MYAYLNGEFVHKSEAKISVLDRGLLFGDGAFDTMRVYGGHIFKLDAHLQRLFSGLDVLRIESPWTSDMLNDIIYQLLSRNKLKDAYIRLTITRGICGRGIDITGCGRPSIVIITDEYKGHPEDFYKSGVKVSLSSTRTNLRTPADLNVKSLNFLNNILAKMEAIGAFETIMLNGKGFLTEGTVSNIFFVTNGVLYTPSCEAGILNGITRGAVLDIAKRDGIPVKEGLFKVTELYQAEEVFLTNSMIEIMPVTEVEDNIFRLGSITERLRNAYKGMIIEEIQSTGDSQFHRTHTFKA